MQVQLDYIAAGGNRHPSAADWAPGLLAFATANSIALWNPEDERQNGVFALLAAHTDVVNAVKIYDSPSTRFIISAGADKTIRIWTPTGQAFPPFEQMQCLSDHSGAVHIISILPRCQLVVTGSTDGTIKLWDVSEVGFKLVQSISLKPRYLPLATAVTALTDGQIVIAVAGTSSSIQLYMRPEQDADFELQASLSGHEGWIRGLDFVHDVSGALLASASQDKYIRLWRFREELDNRQLTNGSQDLASATVKKSLSNKAHRVGISISKYSVAFEALLIGHEDWIYTARWAPPTSSMAPPTLLSASADNSLAIWAADEASGVWVCKTRLGEISAQKGSTTATGSTGGFWLGLWQPDSQEVASLGRTGSWRRWRYDEPHDSWVQLNGTSGHTEGVQSIAWSPDGSYLLSTGSDQSTRLFSEWKRKALRSWHEFSRPQIHGYDLNCIASLTSNQFVSGADEKLLRVFSKPRAIDRLLSKLSGTNSTVHGELPDAANIPVLGLSNKAIATIADDDPIDDTVAGRLTDREDVDPAMIVHKSTLDLGQPPFEDHLARHTLWPEVEKLYGHGYEISAVAASHDGSLIATACKASAIDHAVIRLYETKEWREVKPSLTAHNLTVTNLAFSADDRYLLSVGRDRQWALFRRDGVASRQYRTLTSNPKGHNRMILDCSWAPVEKEYCFATAGRDKNIKVWRLDGESVECVSTIAAGSAATAVAFESRVRADSLRLAFGTEDGSVTLGILSGETLQCTSTLTLEPSLCSHKPITGLRWRPEGALTHDGAQLALASDDGAVRILDIRT